MFLSDNGGIWFDGNKNVVFKLLSWHLNCIKYKMNNRVRFQSATVCADTFEIVSYRDSIKTIDITPLCYLLRLKPYKACRLWVVNDVCGGICVIFTYSLIIFAECVACIVLFCNFWDSVHDTVNAAVFHCCTALAVVSHVVCMFTDPVCIAKIRPFWARV